MRLASLAWLLAVSAVLGGCGASEAPVEGTSVWACGFCGATAGKPTLCTTCSESMKPVEKAAMDDLGALD
ncbi:MAG: hypothetical protein QF615_14065 [Planctomycetota bacterium]|nr:hypothetical protein [Planctomycetota bacterium]